MAATLEHLSPAETARRLGVSVKALRLYEARGLVQPLRLASGWRVYGPEAIARLHQILALKRLGLSLQRIADLFAGREVSLDLVLALQERALAGDRARLDQALALVRTARWRLAEGQALSIDDLATLTKETTMTEPLNEEAWNKIFDPLAKKHFTPEEIETFKERPPFDQQAIGDQWTAIIAEATSMMAQGIDPTSDRAINMARRWKALQELFTGGDPGITLKAKAMWTEAMTDPSTAPKLPMNTELFAYVGKAGEALRAKGG